MWIWEFLLVSMEIGYRKVVLAVGKMADLVWFYDQQIPLVFVSRISDWSSPRVALPH